MTDHCSTLMFSGIETEEKPVPMGISQGSLLSFILYLFYAAELLENYNSPTERLSTCGFVNDTNMLAYKRTTEENCHTLKHMHA
jgi:hypothetical protein